MFKGGELREEEEEEEEDVSMKATRRKVRSRIILMFFFFFVCGFFSPFVCLVRLSDDGRTVSVSGSVCRSGGRRHKKAKLCTFEL